MTKTYTFDFPQLIATCLPYNKGIGRNYPNIPPTAVENNSLMRGSGLTWGKGCIRP
jgi:hypothetical protein